MKDRQWFAYVPDIVLLIVEIRLVAIILLFLWIYAEKSAKECQEAVSLQMSKLFLVTKVENNTHNSLVFLRIRKLSEVLSTNAIYYRDS